MNQLENCELFLKCWNRVLPSEVVENLQVWHCGTQACAGGHLATFPEFQVMGVRSVFVAGLALGPYLEVEEGVTLAAFKLANYLFGDEDLFDMRREVEAGTDHEVVVKRFEAQIERLKCANM